MYELHNSKAEMDENRYFMLKNVSLHLYQNNSSVKVLVIDIPH